MKRYFINNPSIFSIVAMILTLMAVASCANKQTSPQENNSNLATKPNPSPNNSVNMVRLQRILQIKIKRQMRSLNSVNPVNAMSNFCLGTGSRVSCVAAESTCLDPALCLTRIDSGLSTEGEEVRMQVAPGFYMTFFNGTGTVVPGVAFRDLNSEIEFNVKFTVNSRDGVQLEDKVKAVGLIVSRPELSVGIEMSRDGARFIVTNNMDGMINTVESRLFAWSEILKLSDQICS